MHASDSTANNLIFSITLSFGFINLILTLAKLNRSFWLALGSPMRPLSFKSLRSRLVAAETAPPSLRSSDAGQPAPKFSLF